MKRKQADNYKEVQIIKFKNGIARVYIPELTNEERKRRIDEIKKAAASLLKSTYN